MQTNEFLQDMILSELEDAVEEKILLETFGKYGAEDLGSEYGEKWWEEKITFFYPGHMMDLPQMFGTMDTIAPYDKIEKIYWFMIRLFVLTHRMQKCLLVNIKNGMQALMLKLSVSLLL